MDNRLNEVPKHKKRKKRNKPKKADHKHEYELTKKEELAIDGWFNYKMECKICGKTYTELHIEE